MTHEQILNSIKENIQLIYRQSVDADQSIEALKEQDKAKFTAIFGDNTPFTTRSALFLVHVEELAADLLALQQSRSDAEFERDLPRLVKKIELMFKTLQGFKQGLRG
ncbi:MULTISPECIES: hypothetical protein [unclassified Motilimonas]|uniref:hypothetical protein n=1 Tax=Motilimonas TaxID=1914248 RepID=UPI001E4C9A7D|nr:MULTISPECIES: hypothetical protein [unclassified Motilimonas]MCE0557062.1 hypothetical protein [Motilimonas sp. E26]MDO6524295.1 hypothetical protein [Motilimonas sp. 1_MG-2023]